MGIDWEEILDAEGADMADVYNDSIPEEPYEYDTSEEEEDPYDDPNDDDELYVEYEVLTHDQLVDKCVDFENLISVMQDTFDSAIQYIKTLMDLLREHGIQVPEDMEERYNRWIMSDDDREATSSESATQEEKVDNSWLEEFWEEEPMFEDLDNKKK